MLTEIEKEKIRSEEIFREEVRKELATSEKKSKTWMFMNSSIFLWFLSAVVIGLVSYFYNQYHQNLAVENQRLRRINQLDFEIENRVSDFWINLEPFINKATSPENGSISFNSTFNMDTLQCFWKAFKNAPIVNPKFSTIVYEEFDKRTTPSLMFELSSLLEDKYQLKVVDLVHEKNNTLKFKINKSDSIHLLEIRKVRNAAIFISENAIFIDKRIKAPFLAGHPWVGDLWNIFEKRIVKDRWNTYFDYRRVLWDYSNYNPGF
ncbi:MAG: hypothetical protein JWQ38_2865 [Flavipsychrobacter sp.]|nr:hypothetical protein [Flavipsychrobacter sp.]